MGRRRDPIRCHVVTFPLADGRSARAIVRTSGALTLRDTIELALMHSHLERLAQLERDWAGPRP